MNIVSYQESFNDFSDQICLVVFTRSCTLDCPGCYNKNRLLTLDSIDKTEVFNYLSESLPLIKAVTISGGEPTLERGLKEFIYRLKNLDFKVRLDTNGTNTEVLESVLPYLSEVAMDIKEDPTDYLKYKRVCRLLTEEEFSNAQKSLKLLSDYYISNSGDFKLILRTTMFDNLIDVNSLTNTIKNNYNYYSYSIQPKIEKIF